MKKYIIAFTGILVAGSLVLLSCKKKKDDTIAPTYKSDASGTASNPQPNNVTVTGTVTGNVPATNYTYLDIGGAGWSNLSCLTTNSLYLRAEKGDTKVTLNFAQAPQIGTYTYNIATSPGINVVSFQVYNAPDQPSGINWVARSGQIQIVSSLTGISASIQTPIRCYQTNFNFPHVTVTGQFGCN